MALTLKPVETILLEVFVSLSVSVYLITHVEAVVVSTCETLAVRKKPTSEAKR